LCPYSSFGGKQDKVEYIKRIGMTTRTAGIGVDWNMQGVYPGTKNSTTSKSTWIYTITEPHFLGIIYIGIPLIVGLSVLDDIT
jgi:hypothetical protein